MAFKESEIILQDVFCLYPAVSTVCNLVLTEKILYIDYPNNGKNAGENVFVSDIIGCHVLRGKNTKSKNDIKDTTAYICIYSYPLKTSGGILSKQLRRERRALTFQMRKFETSEENLNFVNKWHRAILWLLKGKQFLLNDEVKIPTSLPCCQKLLILVNPHSGPGKAHQIFKERVAPLLVESDTQYDLLVTDRANCAKDYVNRANLSQWNGIVVVSGDGLLFEVYNGLMTRPDWKEAVKIPVGVVPGGSGNGLARAINYAAGEPYDVNVVTPSVLNIIHGRIAPMDLVQVQTATECFYSFLSIGWGLMADIDIESERLRAFGEARFAVWGVIRAIGLRKYKGKLSYLPVSGFEPGKATKAVIEPKPKRSKTLDGRLAWSDDSSIENPGDTNSSQMFRSKSFGTHDSGISGETDKVVRLLKFSYNEELNLDCHDMRPNLDLTESDSEVHIPHDHCAMESIKENIPVEETVVRSSYCPALTEPVPDNWIVIEDDFVLVYACHQTHLSTDVLFAPDAKLDDGIMWLIVIRAGVSRAQVMYFLASLQTGDHVHSPYVDVTPIHAFRLQPSQQDGFMTVDGEVIPCGAIQAEVLPSIARVMSR